MKKFSFHTENGLAIVYAVNAEAALIKFYNGQYRLEQRPSEKIDLGHEGEGGTVYQFATTDQQSV